MRRATACVLVLMGLVLLAPGCGSDAAKRQREREAARARAHAALVARQVSAGRSVFGTHCADCHTIEGRVAHPTFIESPIPNLDEVKPKAEYIVERITTGGFDMPSLNREMSAQEMEDVVAYVANVSGSRVTDTSSSESAALTEGQQLFDANCTRCHALAGHPATNKPPWPWQGTDFDKVRPSQRMVVERVTRGIREEMPSFRGRLTKAQIHALAVYVTATAGR